ncbi:hypothetical protein H0O00_02875 [Candidatus Micrarchaeota archaeon]|nr:hypothetical protein [Candidatus Micrarchaeota archaeon]
MISRRNLDRNLANEKADLIFYLIIEKGGKRMLKPLKLDTKVSLKLVRAIADDTIIPSFYDTLARDLRERGVAPGSKVQLRAKFSPAHEMLDPVLKGTRILCEVDV